MKYRYIAKDHISPLCDILINRDYSVDDKCRRIRGYLYRARKTLNRHTYNQYSLDKAVDRICETSWIEKLRGFNPDEWEHAAELSYKNARKLLGRIPGPELILFPSFNMSNGRVYRLYGRPYIFCSPDFPFTRGRNLKIVVAHEYGHFVRWKLLGRVPSDDAPIYSYIYEEGWATWFSRQVLPDMPTKTLFMANLHSAINLPDPPDGYLRWCSKNLKTLVQKAQEVIGSRDAVERWRFFQCNRFDENDDHTPIRTGYYLGTKLIEMLADKKSPRELLRLKPTAKNISAWLNELI